jgi:hypothetical protein
MIIAMIIAAARTTTIIITIIAPLSGPVPLELLALLFPPLEVLVVAAVLFTAVEVAPTAEDAAVDFTAVVEVTAGVEDPGVEVAVVAGVELAWPDEDVAPTVVDAPTVVVVVAAEDAPTEEVEV